MLMVLESEQRVSDGGRLGEGRGVESFVLFFSFRDIFGFRDKFYNPPLKTLNFLSELLL